jgi:hypothetical protein
LSRDGSIPLAPERQGGFSARSRPRLRRSPIGAFNAGDPDYNQVVVSSIAVRS